MKSFEDLIKYFEDKASKSLLEANLSLVAIGVVVFLIIMYSLSQI